VILKEEKNAISSFLTLKKTGLFCQHPDTPTQMLLKKMKEAKKPTETFLSFKKFKDETSEKKEYLKEKKQKENDYTQEMLRKISMDVKELKHVVPVPMDYETFEKIGLQKMREKGSASQKKTLGFGVGSRMPLSEKEKWVNKVERYNCHSEKRLDPKLDNLPGPSAYSLISHWAGKKPRREKEGEGTKKMNFFKLASKGPIINPYYAKL